jgi:hypothetical protein
MVTPRRMRWAGYVSYMGEIRNAYMVLVEKSKQGTLMMEAASTSETSVNFYQTKRHYNPEDSHLHTCHHENLKS